MVRPVQLDAVWKPNHLAYNRYLAGLLRRACYYRLNHLLRTAVTDLIEECHATWLTAWEIGGAVCGDEAVVPHTGSNWHEVWQYIACKPHSTSIKMYVLCDNTYLSSTCTCTPAAAAASAEPALAPKILMPKASCSGGDSKCPLETVLVADSFFGNHGLAEYFASIKRPFLTLSKRNKKDKALTDVKQRLAKGQVARGVIKAHGYELVAYIKPKVRHKACKALGLVERSTSMWEFQWHIIRRLCFAGPKWCALTISQQVVHAPVKFAGKHLCSHAPGTPQVSFGWVAGALGRPQPSCGWVAGALGTLTPLPPCAHCLLFGRRTACRVVCSAVPRSETLCLLIGGFVGLLVVLFDSDI